MIQTAWDLKRTEGILSSPQKKQGRKISDKTKLNVCLNCHKISAV